MTIYNIIQYTMSILDRFKYLYAQYIDPHAPLSDTTDSYTAGLFQFGKYGWYNHGIANMYDTSEFYGWNDIVDEKTTKSIFLTSNFYAYIAPASNHAIQDKVQLVTPTDDQKNSMNILGMNSQMLTSLLPWNQSEMIRSNMTTGAIVPQCYFLPLNKEQLYTNGLTIIKIVIVAYCIYYLKNKYNY